jgi:TPR repeat protein
MKALRAILLCHALLGSVALVHAEPPISDVAALTARADAEDIEALIELGMRYRDGKGLPNDDRKAVECYRQAVARDNTAAMDHLGWMYLNGRGVPKDYAEAMRLFRIAADRGHAQAQQNLGWMRLNGFGAPTDLQEARELFERAASAGNAGALNNLGEMYACGLSVPRDMDKALEYWRKAAERKLPVAFGRIATHRLFLPGPVGGAQDLAALARAVGDVGNTEALRILGLLYWTGTGVSADPDRARDLWRRADQLDPPKAPGVSMEAWADLRSRPAEPGRFRFLAVDPQIQGLNLCAPTAAAIALSAYGAKVDPFAIKLRCKASPPGTGTAWDQLIPAVSTFGAEWRLEEFDVTDEGFSEGLRRVKLELDAGRPVLLDIRKPEASGTGEGAHTVVAIGYEEAQGVLIVQNPAELLPGVERYPYDEFKRRWQSRWYMPSATREMRPAIFTAPPRSNAHRTTFNTQRSWPHSRTRPRPSSFVLEQAPRLAQSRTRTTTITIKGFATAIANECAQGFASPSVSVTARGAFASGSHASTSSVSPGFFSCSSATMSSR